MKNILDLRFIIGLFFSIAGLLLLIGSEIMEAGVGKTETINFWSGIVYIAFGAFMIVLWLTGRKKTSDEEEVTAPPPVL